MNPELPEPDADDNGPAQSAGPAHQQHQGAQPALPAPVSYGPAASSAHHQHQAPQLLLPAPVGNFGLPQQQMMLYAPPPPPHNQQYPAQGHNQQHLGSATDQQHPSGTTGTDHRAAPNSLQQLLDDVAQTEAALRHVRSQRRRLLNNSSNPANTTSDPGPSARTAVTGSSEDPPRSENTESDVNQPNTQSAP